MKSNLEKLPHEKQRELARVVKILHQEFDDALAGAEAEWEKRGHIWKIFLFGSYAKGKWVDERNVGKGYQSDYDILVIVNNKKFCDYPAFWAKAKDRMVFDDKIDTEVSFIVHSRREVFAALEEGHYFFSDVRKEGIVLYELNDEPLPAPKLLTPRQAYEVAKKHFEGRLPAARSFFETAQMQFAKIREDEYWKRMTAFWLHQAVEQAYSTFLLTLTNYAPASHKLTFLRPLSEGREKRLIDAWPRLEQRHRACQSSTRAMSNRVMRKNSTSARKGWSGSASGPHVCTISSNRCATNIWSS